MNKLVFRQQQLILDADCAINIVASGHSHSILESVPCSCSISRYVHEKELLRHNVQSLINQNLLEIVSPQGQEYDTIIEINFEVNIPNKALGDGEIETAAIAACRNWSIGTNDRKARNFFAKKYPHLQIISTPEFLKHWVDTTSPTRVVVREVLEKIRVDAHYVVGKNHSLYPWWQSWL